MPRSALCSTAHVLLARADPCPDSTPAVVQRLAKSSVVLPSAGMALSHLHIQELPRLEVHDVDVEVVVSSLGKELPQQEDLPWVGNGQTRSRTRLEIAETFTAKQTDTHLSHVDTRLHHAGRTLKHRLQQAVGAFKRQIWVVLGTQAKVLKVPSVWLV